MKTPHMRSVFSHETLRLSWVQYSGLKNTSCSAAPTKPKLFLQAQELGGEVGHPRWRNLPPLTLLSTGHCLLWFLGEDFPVDLPFRYGLGRSPTGLYAQVPAENHQPPVRVEGPLGRSILDRACVRSLSAVDTTPGLQKTTLAWLDQYICPEHLRATNIEMMSSTRRVKSIL